MIKKNWDNSESENPNKYRGQKYFNLQDECLTIFTRPANTCTCPLKVYAIKNGCFGKNYLSFLDFTRNYGRTSGIFVP